MTTPEPCTVFCKAVYATMCAYGCNIRDGVKDVFPTKPDAEGFSAAEWSALVSDTLYNLRDLAEDNNNQRALQCMTDVTYHVTPGALVSYREMVDQLFCENRLSYIWADATIHEDAAYAFALFMLVSGCSSTRKLSLSKAASAVLHKPFTLGQNEQKCKDDFAIAMFGPVWHSLYMKDDLLTAEYIDLVIVQRPPIVGRSGSQNSAGLPHDLGLG